MKLKIETIGGLNLAKSLYRSEPAIERIFHARKLGIPQQVIIEAIVDEIIELLLKFDSHSIGPAYYEIEEFSRGIVRCVEHIVKDQERLNKSQATIKQKNNPEI